MTDEQKSEQDAYQIIATQIIPEVIQLFSEKTKSYPANGSFQFLGSRGQFSDINRKFWKLKAMLWDETLPIQGQGEPVEEVLMDLIGHCLLTIYCLREDN